MTTLTVTAKGQVTLKKELLQHLGVKPGQKIEVNALPGGKLAVFAAREKDTNWDDFIGVLAGRTDKVATIEEMNEAIRRGWAGLHEDHAGYESPGQDGNTGPGGAGASRETGGSGR